MRGEVLRHVSLFTGIGGLDLGLEHAGFTTVRQVEIEPFCLKLLDKHWPSVAKGHDVREEVPSTYEYGPIALVSGGFPCQDISVAGNREGLAGERSGLFFELLRIADSLPTAWVLCENVPGLLSSQKGEDFATVLGGLSGFVPEVPDGGWRNSGVCLGPKGCVAWRVLDAQYFGLAQRRKRVFIVRSPGRSGAFQVLFEPESVSGDSPPGRETGKRIAGTVTQGFGARGVDTEAIASGNYAIGSRSFALQARGNLSMGPSHETYVVDVCGSLTGGGGKHGWKVNTENAADGQLVAHVAPTLSTKNEPASSSSQRWRWMEQSAQMLGAVRRLTPTECERLQGFSDGWTLLLDDKTPDSPRYRALGNAVAVPVAEWIGRRLVEVINSEPTV